MFFVTLSGLKSAKTPARIEIVCYLDPPRLALAAAHAAFHMRLPLAHCSALKVCSREVGGRRPIPAPAQKEAAVIEVRDSSQQFAEVRTWLIEPGSL